MALTAAQTTAAVKLGVAAFGAPISTYTTVFEAVLSSAAPFGGSIENTYTAFLTLVPPYENVTDAAFAATFVETMLGDTVDASAKAASVAYMTKMLAAGVTRGALAAAVIDETLGIPNDHIPFGEASARLENRMVVAEYYTTTYAGTETFVPVLQTILAAVGAATNVSDPASIIDGALNPVTNFTLTTGVDALSPAATDVAFKTGAGADKISGVVSSLSSEGTLQATDSIDGDAGNDTLALDLKASFSGFTGTGGVKNVETIALTNAGTIDRTFSTKGITGATTYNLKSTGAAISLSDLAAAGGTVNVEGQTKGALTVGYTAAALAGTADALTLGLNNVGTLEVKDAAGGVTTAQQAVALTTTAGLESLAVMAMGANVVSLAGTNAGKITVSGAGSLKVTEANAALTSFDASAATGAITADLTAVATGGTLTAVKGGAGDDAFTVNALGLAANVVLEGGAGANSLTIKGGSGTLQPVMSGFQTLGINTLANHVTLSGKNAEGLSTVSLGVANALSAHNLTVANLTSSEFTVKSTGAQSAATVTLTPAAALTYTTTASAEATVAKANAEAVETAIKATEATSATINVGAYTSQTGQIDVVKAATVILNVASGKNAAGTTELTKFAGILNADAATSLVVNASGLLENATLKAQNAGTVELTAAAGSVGKVTVNAAKATQVTITAGGEMDLNGSDFSAAEQVTIVANKGGIVGGVTLNKVNALTVSGGGATSKVSLGALGSSAQEYALNVTASGLKGGLILGGATTKASITIDLEGMTGTSSLGTLNGAAVTVNAAGALNTVTSTGITAKTAVTYNGSELKLNNATVNASSDSTALTVVLNGGIANDTYMVRSVNSSTSTTVSGDVGIGTNVVTIDGANAGAATGFTLNASGLTGAGATTINLKGSSSVKNTITGSAVADVITGGAASDTINGGAGDDTIDAGAVTAAAVDAAAVVETATLTLDGNPMFAGQTFTVAGLTYTSTGLTLSGDLGAAFANLANGATIGAGAGTGTYSGTLTGYSTSALVGNVITFTASAAGVSPDVTVSGTSLAATQATTNTTQQGAAATVASTASMDTLTGGTGSDTFKFSTPDVDTSAGVFTATITDFVSGTDKIQVVGGGAGTGVNYVEVGAVAASLTALLVAADAALTGAVRYYVGQVGADAYVVTDNDATGYTNVIKLTGVTVDGIAFTDFIA